MVVAGAVVGLGLIFAGSRPMVAVLVFVVVVVVALVALTLLPLGLQSSFHVHAWRVGVTAGGTFIGCSASYVITSCARVIVSKACCVGSAIAICYGKQGKKTGRRLPSFLREKRGGGGEEEKSSYGSVGVVYGSVGVVSLC